MILLVLIGVCLVRLLAEQFRLMRVPLGKRAQLLAAVLVVIAVLGVLITVGLVNLKRVTQDSDNDEKITPQREPRGSRQIRSA